MRISGGCRLRPQAWRRVRSRWRWNARAAERSSKRFRRSPLRACERYYWIGIRCAAVARCQGGETWIPSICDATSRFCGPGSTTALLIFSRVDWPARRLQPSLANPSGIGRLKSSSRTARMRTYGNSFIGLWMSPRSTSAVGPSLIMRALRLWRAHYHAACGRRTASGRVDRGHHLRSYKLGRSGQAPVAGRDPVLSSLMQAGSAVRC